MRQRHQQQFATGGRADCSGLSVARHHLAALIATVLVLSLLAHPATADGRDVTDPQSWQMTIRSGDDDGTNAGWAAVLVMPSSAGRKAATTSQRPLTTGSIQRSPALTQSEKSADPLRGIASYYWQDQMTASGVRFDKRALTAAHRTLPFGTRVRVTCAATHRSVVVTINDRGPFKPGRIIDLSERAAEEIGMTQRGVTPVSLEVVTPAS